MKLFFQRKFATRFSFISNIIISFFMRYFIGFLLITSLAFAQKKNEKYQYHIFEAKAALKIDGIEDDAAWKSTEVAKDFFMITPMDTSFAHSKTEVRLCYDRQNLYILAINYKAKKGSIVVESLKRDFNFGANDNFFVVLDTFEDLTNGFSFGASAAGAIWDGQQADGGMINLNWDNKWVSATKNYEDRWVWEASIPFKSIRYDPNQLRWGFNGSRLDVGTNEKSAWTPIPRQFQSANLAYAGVLVWDKPLPAAGKNISLIPYTLAGVTKDFTQKTDGKWRTDVGGDAKIAINSSMNLDLTVNPDFSQVEVDVQQTNLDRFELFFPERRQFFLENADLFANFGFQTIRPFFSRRIGLGVPIVYGARLSGKLDRNWRIGILDTQTQKQNDMPAQNFAVVALQRKVFTRSNVGILLVNKESLNFDEQINKAYSKYNRNIGLEYNLASSNNIWTGKASLLKSFSPHLSGNDMAWAANISYNKANFFWAYKHEYVGENYNAEVGYVPNAIRKGYQMAIPSVGYLFFVNTKNIISHGPFTQSTLFWDKTGNMTDRETFLAYNVNFRSRAQMTAWVANNYVQLFADADPTNTGKPKLKKGTEHGWNAWGTEYHSSPRNVWTVNFNSRYGGYFMDGTRLNLSGTLGYRFQPYISTKFAVSYNDIRMPAPYNQIELWLVGPRVDVTFTNNLFWTTFLQYNSQAKNINLNARLQWRYKPASDLFIVYTDNYLPENMNIKNRALIFKLTYWWNV
jgi:Domain of unknown function (DUF5916)/Carbohydrate family 9 binding domain-like